MIVNKLKGLGEVQIVGHSPMDFDSYPVEHKLDMTEDYKNFIFTTPEGSVGCRALNIV